MSDHNELRNALGQFATGVAIVTASDKVGSEVGLTINSFTSVSLDPPIVSWSLARNANTLEVFRQSSFFAIHVLTEKQLELSRRFAKKIANKFEGVSLEYNNYQLPLFSEYASRFICKKYCTSIIGDHVVFTGLVESFASQDHFPLLFVKGNYASVSSQKDHLQKINGSVSVQMNEGERAVLYRRARISKEFVNGDFGRTRPSLADIINEGAPQEHAVRCELESLDVIAVDLPWPPKKVTTNSM